jgi:hypothetical protein
MKKKLEKGRNVNKPTHRKGESGKRIIEYNEKR